MNLILNTSFAQSESNQNEHMYTMIAAHTGTAIHFAYAIVSLLITREVIVPFHRKWRKQMKNFTIDAHQHRYLSAP